MDHPLAINFTTRTYLLGINSSINLSNSVTKFYVQPSTAKFCPGKRKDSTKSATQPAIDTLLSQ
jgi:hypothetical protein